MHGLELLQDLAVVLLIAGVVTVIFHRLRQPVVLGYIVAGIIIGPHTPPFALVANEKSIHTLADLGIVFLMFSIGLEMDLRKLKRVGATALIAATLEIVIMVSLGYGVGRAFGWKATDSLFLGAILSISSTTIIAKALAELGLLKERFSEVIFGILIVEDLLGIVMLALLSGLAATGEMQGTGALLTLGKLAVFLVAVIVLGRLLVPRLLRLVARYRRDEMLVVTVLALCLGGAVLAAKLGYSVALGAFLIGALVAEWREHGRAEVLIAPVRDLFSAVFFVAVGLLIDPAVLAEHWLAIGVITVTVILGKVLSGTLGTLAAGRSLQTAARVGLGLAQIGEFSFIIASLGVSSKLTGDFLYPVAVAVSVVTTLATPYLIRAADPVSAWLTRRLPRPLTAQLNAYARWFARTREPGEASRALRGAVLSLTVHLALLAGVFLTANLLAEELTPSLPELPAWLGGRRGLLGVAAFLVSLPLFFGCVRTLRRLRESLVRSAEPARVSTLNAVGRTLQLLGAASVATVTIALASALLPGSGAVLWLLLIAAAAGVLLRRSVRRVYEKAEGALESPEPAEEPVEPVEPRTVPTALRNAVLETVPFSADTWAAHRLLRETELRSRTGASVVAIERAGGDILNPGPDEELLPGDGVVVIGDAGQVAAARELLRGGPKF